MGVRTVEGVLILMYDKENFRVSHDAFHCLRSMSCYSVKAEVHRVPASWDFHTHCRAQTITLFSQSISFWEIRYLTNNAKIAHSNF